jgi:hypothetical protein
MAIALMMEAASTSETSVNFYQATRHNNKEDSHLQTRHRENLKSDNEIVYYINIMIKYSRFQKKKQLPGRFSLCSFLHPSVNSFFLGPNALLSTLVKRHQSVFFLCGERQSSTP